MGKSCQPSEVELQKLQQWTAAHGTPQQVALHCRIVLAAAAGKTDVDIAEQLSVNRHTVILWRKRFADEGLERFVGYRSGPRTKTDLFRRPDCRPRRCHFANETCGDDPLELSDDGTEAGR